MFPTAPSLTEVVAPPAHKHKMEIITVEKVRLVHADGTVSAHYDEFTFKGCKCGFKEPIKVERKLGKMD